jgi:hypothetical protein
MAEKHKIGLDDFLCAHTVEELRALPREPIETNPDLDILLEEMCPDSDTAQIEHVLKTVACLENEIDRDRAIKQIHKRTEVRYGVLRQQVAIIRTQPAQVQPQVPAEPTGSEREDAERLLRNPGLLLEFLSDLKKLGCVGQESEATVLKLAAVSGSLSNDPINVNVKGESAAGKNHLLHSVLETEPPEDVIEITRMTGKALDYFPKTLRHKIISITEASGGENADYSIRTFQSEKMIRILVPEKDESGHIETRERVVEGPAAFFQTTTKAHLHPENETRCFDVFVDESEVQTERIFAVQNQRYQDPIPAEKRDRTLQKWRNAARLLAPVDVLIPYAHKVTFPTKPLRVRRDRPRLLALVEASALLHQKQREVIERNNKLYLVAGVEDYVIARELAVVLLQSILSGANPKCKSLVDWAQKWVGTEGKGFSKREVDKALGWTRKTTLKYLAEAVSLGCIGMSGNEVKNSKIFGFVKPVESPHFTMPEPEELLTGSDPVVHDAP